MEPIELIKQIMDDYRLVIYVLAGVVTVLGGVIVKMYLRFEKQKKEDRDREHEDKERLIKLMEADITSRKDFQNTIENNTKVIRELPDTIFRMFPDKRRTSNG